MKPKTLLLAIAAFSTAMLAPPTVASAQSWHFEENATPTFSVASPGGTWTTTEGTTIACTGIAGSGSYETSTTGKITLSFSGCGSKPENCVVAPPSFTASLPIHNIMMATNKPAILITGTGASNHLISYSCFGIPVVLTGGLIGTVAAPACGAKTNALTLSFSSSSPGHSADKLYTGTSYYITNTIGGSSKTQSIDASTTLTFNKNVSIQCTH